MKSGRGLQPNLSRKKIINQLSVILVAVVCMLSACKEEVRVSEVSMANVPADTNLSPVPPEAPRAEDAKPASCYAYLTELVRSSNFPFKDIEPAKVNILIDEDSGDFLRLKLFVDTDGSGTLGWVEYYPGQKN